MCRVSLWRVLGLDSRLPRLGDPVILIKSSHRFSCTVSKIVFFLSVIR